MSEADRPRAPEWLGLDAGETVWLRASPSNNLLLAGVGVGFVVLVVGSVGVGAVGSLRTGRLLSAAMLAVVVGLLAGAFLLTKRYEYVLTSERVYRRVGLTSGTVESVALDRVREVSLDRPRWQRWIGVGSLRFVTDDADEDVAFDFVESPDRVFEHVADHVESARPEEAVR